MMMLHTLATSPFPPFWWCPLHIFPFIYVCTYVHMLMHHTFIEMLQSSIRRRLFKRWLKFRMSWTWPWCRKYHSTSNIQHTYLWSFFVLKYFWNMFLLVLLQISFRNVELSPSAVMCYIFHKVIFIPATINSIWFFFHLHFIR